MISVLQWMLQMMIWLACAAVFFSYFVCSLFSLYGCESVYLFEFQVNIYFEPFDINVAMISSCQCK